MTSANTGSNAYAIYYCNIQGTIAHQPKNRKKPISITFNENTPMKFIGDTDELANNRLPFTLAQKYDTAKLNGVIVNYTKITKKHFMSNTKIKN